MPNFLLDEKNFFRVYIKQKLPLWELFTYKKKTDYTSLHSLSSGAADLRDTLKNGVSANIFQPVELIHGSAATRRGRTGGETPH